MFDVRPRVAGRVMYDDNITIRSAHRREDVIWMFSPGLSLTAGDAFGRDSKLLVLDYSPAFHLFTDYSEFNSIDHVARVSGIVPFARLTLGATHTFQQLSGEVIDVGNRVDRRVFHTVLSSRYELSEKTSFEINGRHTRSDYQRHIDSTDWGNDNWINYQIFPKLSLGLGASFGWIEIERNPDQTYQRAMLRALYQITGKIDLNASAGGEWRQYDDDTPGSFAPVFSMGAGYRPRDGTSLSLQAQRQVQHSVFLGGHNYISTGLAGTVRQRFLEKYFASVGASYYNLNYRAARAGVVADREDDYFLIRTALESQLTERWRAALFYSYRENTSNRERFAFTKNQIGLESSWAF
jgi:hypothetical protein